MAIINLLLKLKYMLKYFFDLFLFYVYKKRYNFFFIFERLGRMHENKIFFLFYNLFCNVLTKTRYFNIGFVSLRYKNTSQYYAK
jgi:hypothetical protein